MSAHDPDSLYASRVVAGKSPRTIRDIHNVISASLNQAVRWEWLEKNVAERVILPVASVGRVSSPTADQARRLIAACQQRVEALGAFVFLATVTGSRRGEVAALRWSSLSNGTILVRESAHSISGDEGVKSTKSGRERVIQLAPEVVVWLGKWRHSCEINAHK